MAVELQCSLRKGGIAIRRPFTLCLGDADIWHGRLSSGRKDIREDLRDMALPHPVWHDIDNGLKINIAWHPKNRFPSYYIVVVWQDNAFTLSGPTCGSYDITHKNGVSCGGSCSFGVVLCSRMQLVALMGIG